jgi:hypothetical protein|tara:strand:+ start:2407 stop:2616 length:210 start_codon:yes stop_codon:yes gene_type:complete
MSDDGMHKNVGGREKRPLTQMQSDKSEIIIGFSGVRKRARLSNAVGYQARDAPREKRGKYRITDREKLL